MEYERNVGVILSVSSNVGIAYLQLLGRGISEAEGQTLSTCEATHTHTHANIPTHTHTQYTYTYYIYN